MSKIDLSLNEELTLEMTNLANERSLLAYMRTFVVFLSSGIAILKIELFQDMILLAYFLIAISIFWVVIGFIRFRKVNTLIKKMANSTKDKQTK